MTAQEMLSKKPANGEYPNYIHESYAEDAMEEYAKQESIEFAKWGINNAFESVVLNKVMYFYIPGVEGRLTTEELYEKYQQSKTQ
jgi:hypothetical protein